MSLKLTYEEVKVVIQELGYDLLNKEYISVSQKLILKDRDGYFYYSSLSTLRKHIPDKFNKSNPYTIQNIKLWCKLNDKPFELISDTYIGVDEYLLWKCLKNNCGEIFKATWGNIYTGKGCGYCRGLQVGLSNCLATKRPDQALQWHPTLNKELTPFDITSKSHVRVWWQCLENSAHIWQVSPASRSKGDTGCPSCRTSKGEIKIKGVCDNKSILYESQKSFEGLLGINNGLLSYDFYLPKYNLLIEYQGNYHNGTARGQSKQSIKKQKEHDKRKKEYAEQNKYNFLEIWYWDFDRIEVILDEYLNKLTVNK